MTLRDEIAALSAEFERRSYLSTAQLARVTKQRLLAKCASDLRELLADPRYDGIDAPAKGEREGA